MILNPLLNAELSENVQPMFHEMLFSPGGIFLNFEITASIQYSGPPNVTSLLLDSGQLTPANLDRFLAHYLQLKH